MKRYEDYDWGFCIIKVGILGVTIMQLRIKIPKVYS